MSKGSVSWSDTNNTMEGSQKLASTTTEGTTEVEVSEKFSRTEEIGNTMQPDKVVLGSHKELETQKGEKVKKNKWDPVIPVRRSTRNRNCGMTMMDKAQEAK